MVLERMTFGALAERLSELGGWCRPAVVTDMARGLKLGQIQDLHRARELLGGVKVTVCGNYIQSHLERVRRYQRGVPMPKGFGYAPSTFAQYLDSVPVGSRRAICEEPTPAALLEGLDFGPVGVDTVISGCGDFTPLNPAPPTTVLSMFFVASGGNSSDLHADGDGRDVLLHQGFGRKRVVLFPPEAAPLLHPVANFSTIPLARMGDAERAAFVAYAGGTEHVLSPGETLFMPAFVWHHFDYLDTSMSVSFRFGGISSPDAREMLRAVHLDHYTMNILAGTRNPNRAERCREAARRLCEAAHRRYPSTREKYRAMRALAADCHRSTLLPGDRDYLLGIIEAEDFLDGALSGCYSHPPEGSALRCRLWRLKEGLRDRLRRWGRRLAYWA